MIKPYSLDKVDTTTDKQAEGSLGREADYHINSFVGQGDVKRGEVTCLGAVTDPGKSRVGRRRNVQMMGRLQQLQQDKNGVPGVLWLTKDGDPPSEFDQSINRAFHEVSTGVMNEHGGLIIPREMVTEVNLEVFETIAALYIQDDITTAFEKLLTHYKTISPEFAENVSDFEKLCGEHNKADGFKRNHVKNFVEFRHSSFRMSELKTALTSTLLPTDKKFGTAVVRMLSIEEIIDGLEVHQAINEIANKEHELVISLFEQGLVSEAWDRLVKFRGILYPATFDAYVGVYVTGYQQLAHVANVVAYGMPSIGADDVSWNEDTVKQLLENFTGAFPNNDLKESL